MSLDPKLLDILACPRDKAADVPRTNPLVNERLGIAYPIEDSIPVMLSDEAFDWPR